MLTPYRPAMRNVTDNHLEIAGYALWLVGSLLFAITSARNGDTLAFVGSVLFFVGIFAVMVPLARRARERWD